MSLKHVFSLSALAGLAAAFSNQTYNETINGYYYVHWGPDNVAPQAQYELAGAQNALPLLVERLGEDKFLSMIQPNYTSIPEVTVDNLDAVKGALKMVKAQLGPNGLQETLKPDIEAANEFWHNNIDNSDPDTDTWKVTETYAVGFLPDVTMAVFALWESSSRSPATYNDNNPAHYIDNTTQIIPGVQSSTFLEGGGGETTLYNIPAFGPFDRLTYPFLALQPDFPLQAAGSKTLLDGTNATYGVLHICMRDVDGAAYGQNQTGIEIYSAVWYGNALSDDNIEQESQHMVNDIINFTQQCQADIDSGAWSPL